MQLTTLKRVQMVQKLTHLIETFADVRVVVFDSGVDGRFLSTQTSKRGSNIC
ncbi:hypothetical protein LB577_31330 [Mesorhizobium sp. B283B1A]|uniref:hypothetical protein n=1 Tax=Mesorhizobium TaxID=68287 RepID=UPI001CD0B4D8|nr:MULTISPECIES: hypothetical protein [Mesorhizobium]MCA0051402.1 hypothetical protein [Mesorhizobium sp. B283B1A]UQS62747.1 hypothetical protein M5D98_21635 [Mesorhizobium opportunistum]